MIHCTGRSLIVILVFSLSQTSFASGALNKTALQDTDKRTKMWRRLRPKKKQTFRYFAHARVYEYKHALARTQLTILRSSLLPFISQSYGAHLLCCILQVEVLWVGDALGPRAGIYKRGCSLIKRKIPFFLCSTSPKRDREDGRHHCKSSGINR